MPSPSVTDDDATPAKSKTPSTPRRDSTSKRTSNGTPSGKNASQKAKAPNSTPARAMKKAEPTLLGDFLLGRPSPARTRRKSLDLMKAEMKTASVSKVQQPGGVKDRVKQWQKASAAAVIEDPLAPGESEAANNEVVVKEIILMDPVKTKANNAKVGRQKGKDSNGGQVNRQKSKSAPKKRVVSDDHWMANKAATRNKAEKKIKAGTTLPNFVRNNPTNPPLEKKIGDWAKRIVKEEIADTMPTKDKRTKSPLSSPLLDDGIQAKPSNSSSPIDDGIRIIPTKEEGTSKTHAKANMESGTSRLKIARHLGPPDQNGVLSGEESREEQDGREEEVRRSSRSRQRQRRSRCKSSSPTESLVDVPVGYSAFSVLDLPLGADVNAMKMPKPQRTGSLSAVPKVFKKVYNEGLKIMHDANEPHPRSGVNQPPSIESWLNGTTDPFIDEPSNPAGIVAPNKDPEMLSKSNQLGSVPAAHAESEETRSPSRTHKQASGTQKMDYISGTHSLHGAELKSSELHHESYTRKIPSQRENVTHIGSGLKRAPAKRIVSSPRMSPLKEVLVEAFKGESEMYMSKNSLKSPPDETRTSRATDSSGSPRDTKRDSRRPSFESLRRSPGMPDMSKFDKTEKDSEKLNTQRDLIKAGRNRLPIIASNETLTSISSIPETGSELSQTTITQAAARTAASYIATSYTGTSYAAPTESTLSRQPNRNSALKRRLTKHSDLISVLSLPDTAGPIRGKSIRSARSIRTQRNKLLTATVDDLLKELATDESKYMRELRTLVDGVIPVLLTSVLSRSSSAIAAGLFDPNLGQKADTIVTKPIVDMGVALERLRSLHKRIPMKDTKSLVQWAYGAHKVYEDYLTAWRMGFQDVVVNLAPASHSALSSDDLNLLNELPRCTTGDVTETDGERVDVAFLLKRPLVRIKYLLRLFEGISGCDQVGNSTQVLARGISQKFQASKERAQRRVSEETARLEDQAANNIDASLARDPRNLNPLDDVQIDRTRQVAAMDEFTLDFYHSTGQSLNCRTEIILRDKPKDESDVGDLLICETDEIKRWLLFPPIALHLVSARPGDKTGEIVVMIRGCDKNVEWHELLTLKTDDEDIVDYWLGLFSSEPIPGSTELPVQALIDPSTMPRRMPTVKGFDIKSLPTRPPSPCESEHPMGTRVKRRDSRSKIRREPEYGIEPQFSGSPSMFARLQNRFRSSPKTKDSHEISDQSPTSIKQKTALNHSRRYSDTTDVHSPKAPTPDLIAGYKLFYDRPNSPDETLLPARPILNNQRRPSTPSRELPYIPKRRGNNRPTSPPDPSAKDLFSSSPLKESMRPDNLEITPKKHMPLMPSVKMDSYREGDAPPPPVHRILSPVDVKQTLVLDPTTAKPKTRRSSSPLKHEYQPSVASEDESSSDVTASSDDSYTDSSDYSEDESGSEFFDDFIATPPISKVQQSPPESTFNLSTASMAHSNSASQVVHNNQLGQPAVETLNFVAQIYHWDDKGRWEKLHPDIASVVVMPGQVEVFVMNFAHSNSREGKAQSLRTYDPASNTNVGAERPLLAFDLTPWVPMRKSNATDVDVRSPPLPQSLLKPTSHVMFRSINTDDCWALYNALNHSRSNNVRYQQLAQEALLNSYGSNAYENAIARNRRRTWLFGRKKSYRAQVRAPSETNESASSFKSSFSALLRGGTSFNIARSRIERQEGIASGPGSLYGSSESASYGFTPPHTPSSPGSLATGNTFSSSHVASLGTANIKIRLHRFEGRGKWRDLSYCHLTVSPPPLGRRQASSLNNGIEKHLLITTKPKYVDKSKPELGYQDPIGIMDVVLGSRCFRAEGKTGILINIWEDFMLRPTGGVSGTTRKWMMQMETEAERRWVFGLLGNGIL